MGTATTVPEWTSEILFIEHLSCTEKQLYEEFSVLTLKRLSILLELRDKAERFRGQQQRHR